MENNINKEYRLPESIINKLEKVGVDVSKLEICTLIEEDRQSHYWYGGDTVKIMHNGFVFTKEMFFMI